MTNDRNHEEEWRAQFQDHYDDQVVQLAAQFRSLEPVWQDQLLDKSDLIRTLSGADSETTLRVLLAYQCLIQILAVPPYTGVAMPYWVLGILAALSDAVKIEADLDSFRVE